jgi:hypothetical protein
VGSQAKVLVPIGLLGLVVAGLAFWRFGLAVGIGVLVIVALAVVAVGQRVADETWARDDDREVGWEPSWPADLGPDQPLAMWTPPAPSTDRPTVDQPTVDQPTVDQPTVDQPTTERPTTERPTTERPTVDRPAPVTTWHDGSTWATRASLDHNPLDDLVGLDQVDVVAEVERLETGGPPLHAVPQAPHRVDEDVDSPDDIMAASHATELAVHGQADDNSELARLLAKVQARLTAYE